MWWTEAVLFLAAVHAMGNDHVVFTEEPAFTTFSSKEMEGYNKPFRKHPHKINGKIVLFQIYLNTLNVQYLSIEMKTGTELCKYLNMFKWRSDLSL